MSIEREEITNISDNLIQVFTIDNYSVKLEYLTNLKRWIVGVDGVFGSRIIAPNTDLLSEYNLGFYLACESSDDIGPYLADSFLEDGNSKLYIIREV